MENAPLAVSAPFRAAGDHIALDLPGACVLFTTRRGGRSSGPYASLNLGTTFGVQSDDVLANRCGLAEGLGVRLAHAHQVHGAVVALAGGSDPRGESGPVGESSPTPQADGQVTATPGVAATVMVADCLPVAVAGEGAVAMLHAGWRGLAAGIIDAGVARLRALGVTGPLHGAIGPGAGPCCYEVGEEVHAVFERHGPAVRRGRHLDLQAIAARLLTEAGVQRVHDVGLCTICSDPSLFFSHRRDHGVTGRQAGLAWLA